MQKDSSPDERGKGNHQRNGQKGKERGDHDSFHRVRIIPVIELRIDGDIRADRTGNGEQKRPFHAVHGLREQGEEAYVLGRIEAGEQRIVLC